MYIKQITGIKEIRSIVIDTPSLLPLYTPPYPFLIFILEPLNTKSLLKINFTHTQKMGEI